MMPWLHPGEQLLGHKQAAFDPVVEGARHGLSPELSRAVWQRVSAEHASGARPDDAEQLHRRFHEVAARLVARGLQTVGKRTLVDVERGAASFTTAWLSDVKGLVPGRR